MSATHSAQVAASGTTPVVTAPPRLATMRKSGGAFARQRCRFDQVDSGEGRGLRRERNFELDDDRRMPESANEHALAVVPDVASQAEAFRETPHRGAEAYALHEATHTDGYSFELVYCVQPRPPNAPCKPCMDRKILQYAGLQWASSHLFVGAPTRACSQAPGF